MSTRVAKPLSSKLSEKTLSVQIKFKELIRKLASWCDEAHVDSLPAIYGDYEMNYYLNVCKGVVTSHKHFSIEDEGLINHIQAEKNIDSIVFMALKYRIEQAAENNSTWIDSFCACGGVKVLIDKLVFIQSIKPQSFSKFHARCVFQIVKCLKTMIQVRGVSYVISIRGAIQAFVMSLDFTYKPLVTEVLDILSVILFTREVDAIWEVKIALKQLANSRCEKLFEIFTKAILLEDIGVKIAILDFINNLFWGQEDICGRIEDRVSLESVGFTAACEEAITLSCSKQKPGLKHSSLRKQELATLAALQPIKEQVGDDDSDYGELEDNEEAEDGFGSLLGDSSNNYDSQGIIPIHAKVSGMWSIFPEASTKSSEFREQHLGFSDSCLLLDTWVEIRGREIWFWESGVDYTSSPPTVSIPVRMLQSIDYFTTQAEIQMKFEFAFCLCFEDNSKIHCGFDDIEEMEQWSQNLHDIIDEENELKCVFPSIYDVSDNSPQPPKTKKLLKSFVVYQHYDTNDRQLVTKDLTDQDFLCSNPTLISNYIELRLLLIDQEEIRYNVVKTLSGIAETLSGNLQSAAFILDEEDIILEEGGDDGDGDGEGAQEIVGSLLRRNSSDVEQVDNTDTDSVASSGSSRAFRKSLRRILQRNSASMKKTMRRFSSSETSLSDSDGQYAVNSIDTDTISEESEDSEDSDDDDSSSPITKLFKCRQQLKAMKKEIDRLKEMLSDRAQLADAIEERTSSIWDSHSNTTEAKIKEIVVNEVAAMSTSTMRLSQSLSPRRTVRFDQGFGGSETPGNSSNATSSETAAAVATAASVAVATPAKSVSEITPSSPSASWASGVSMSAEDLAVFKNMKESIRRKMYMKGFSKEAVDNFIGNSDLESLANGSWNNFTAELSPTASVVTATAAAETLTPDEMMKYSKYYMQRIVMKTPAAKVRAAMLADGIPEVEADRFLSLTNKAKVPSPAEPPVSSPAPLTPIERGQRLDDSRFSSYNNSAAKPEIVEQEVEEDPKFAKYRKMQKMALPEGAIRQKMSAEGITPSEIESFFQGKAPSSSRTASASASNASKQSEEEDPKFEKFRKMQKMSLPEGAIRQKMMQEGLSAAEIDKFFSGPVATAAPVSSEQTEIEAKFEKFRKMQRMNLPEGAIRQKMSTEGISVSEQDAFFSGKLGASSSNATASASASASETFEDPKFEKFRKMQKMSIPEGAIRNKMTAEGITAAEQDQFFSGKASTATGSTNGGDSFEDLKFEKFRKMQKMSIPEGAIRNKMNAEGISAAEQDQFFSGKAVAALGTGAVATGASIAEDAKYDKFRKMQKMSLPEGAIRQKMVGDGLSEIEITKFFTTTTSSFFGGSVGGEAQQQSVVERVKHEPPARKMRNVFITKLSGKELVESVWSKVDEIKFDLTDLEHNFGDSKPGNTASSKGANAAAAAGTAGSDGNSDATTIQTKSTKPTLLGLFDGKRTQNTSIFITSCRKSVDELYQFAVSMAPDLLTKDMSIKLLANIPTAEETEAVRPHEEAALDITGKLFKKLSLIPRLQRRLEIQLIIFNWDSRADELVSDLNTLSAATTEVTNSLGDIKKTFAAIISVVNYLNAGTARAQAGGMKLEDLKKLSDVKPVAGASLKGSLLHYVDNVIYSGCGSTPLSPQLLEELEANSDQPEVVLKSFCDGWLSVYNCSKISMKQILDVGVTELQRMISTCKEELTATANTTAEYRQPLCHRIDHFLDHADLRVVDIEKQAKHVEQMIKRVRCLFGEGESTASGDCISMSFFGPFGDFAANYTKAHSDNNKLRLAEFKKIQKTKAASKKEAKQLQSLARVKSIKSRLSVSRTALNATLASASTSGSAAAISSGSGSRIVSTRNPHPKLHSVRFGTNGAMNLLELLEEEREDENSVENEVSSSKFQQPISSPKPQTKLTRNKQALSVTPNLFNQMRASQSLSPNVISSLYMGRQKSLRQASVRFINTSGKEETK